MLEKDPINPQHYKTHESGIECIDVVEHMNFCLGNAIKYMWRAGLKGDHLEDLKKARWYLDREISKLEKEKSNAKVIFGVIGFVLGIVVLKVPIHF